MAISIQVGHRRDRLLAQLCVRMPVSVCALLGCLFPVPGLGMAQNTTWKEFAEANWTFSFYYPPDWSAVETPQSVNLRRASTGEEMVIVPFSPDPPKAPLDYALEVLRRMQAKAPGLTASNATGNEKTATADYTYPARGATVPGVVLVVKKHYIVAFLTYSAPPAGFDRQRGLGLLQKVAATLFLGNGARAPGIPAGPSSLIGTWITEAGRGEMVNSATGASQGAAYSGETYVFERDGTYLHRRLGSGVGISGVAVAEGRYTVQGDLLILHQASSSWNGGPQKPSEETTKFLWFMQDARTLVLDDADADWDPTPYSSTTLYRFTEQQEK